MRFNPKAKLDTKRVRDVGGSGGSGGSGGGAGGGMGGIPLPTGKMGLGAVVIILLAVFVLPRLGLDMGSITGGSAGLDPSRVSSATDTGRYDNCTTGEDANGTDDAAIDCQLVAVENSLNDYWSTQPQAEDKYAAENAVITFSGAVSTACGNATSGVGPFYCPGDQTIYLDTDFYRDVLQGQLGGQDAPFVRAYVIAHEFGHHMQNLIGYMNQVKSQEGPKSGSVRLELQADCFAGMWARHATTTEDADGNVLLLDLTDADIEEGIGAAKTVGDDYIQQQTGSRVDSDSWTHGSSAQRIKWFKVGFSSDDINQCNTFATDDL